ncbi:arylalkylamine N-acetyltransferase 1-like [Bactrocera neohumeralis]|uniref:arylalkylamine N-acetyltransferase 1-like n=1 Tax=Bactrocera neohumeralis TaxID=98809 RepID=UPI0021653AF7|nr:arylalkylamine N-acetyltransferase 1-like [Bactrocera neohumeralis]
MTGSETKPSQADNIHIRAIKLSESDDVLKFIQIHFYPDEPMNIGSAQGHPDLEDEQFNISLIAHGTSLMAVQQETADGFQSERIVGILLSGPKHSNEAEHLFKEAARYGSSNWGTQVGILAQAERDSNVYERYNIERALHIYALAVDKSLRGRAIGMRLIKKFKGLGRELKYPLMTLDCTSFYSAKLAERLGMDCVNVIKYADYLDKEGKVVYKPPPPHEYLKTYAMRL